VPPERYRDWAKALGIEEREFICQMLRHYDPALFSMVFPYLACDEVSPVARVLGRRGDHSQVDEAAFGLGQS
jgi:hypothetical protein